MKTADIEGAPTVFAGRRFTVKVVDLPADQGQAVRRDLVVHPGAAVVLPLLDDDTVLLERNERFAVGQTLWELPAGTLEPPESPRDCAARELIEETGYQAGLVEPLTEFYSSPGICTEKMYCFLARQLTPAEQNLDAGERLTVHPTSLKHALAMVETGEIQDAKTIAALLFYWTFRHQH